MIGLSRTSRAHIGTLSLLAAASLCGCWGKEKSEVEVEVRSVGFDNASNAPVVLLQDHDRKVALPIWIGPAEAQSIAMQMQGVNPPRPLTHDLIKNMLDQVGVQFERVVIQELKESTYYARIYLKSGRQDVQIDSRPSDAIALAVRFHSPIFVAAGLMKGEATIDLQHVAPAGTTMKYSGITVQNLTAELAEYFSVPSGKGVIVADIEHDAPQGLKRGDIILAVEGEDVTGVGDFTSKMRALKSGVPAHLSVQRGTEHVPVTFLARAG
jgi:uncharacterized protein